MSNKKELDLNELENVSGGMSVLCGYTCYSVYDYADFYEGEALSLYQGPINDLHKIGIAYFIRRGRCGAELVLRFNNEEITINTETDGYKVGPA